MTLKQRRKLSIARKKLWTNPTPAMIDGMRRRNLKQWTRERRNKQARYAKQMVAKRRADPKSRRKHDRQLKRALIEGRWARPEAHAHWSQKMGELRAKWQREGRLHVCPSRPQRELFKMIRDAGLRGFSMEVQCWRYSLDIAHRRLKLCIEVDGEYWHSVNKTNYVARDAYLNKHGWKIKHVGTTLQELQKALAWAITHSVRK